MTVERSLNELAVYWHVKQDDDTFLVRLNSLLSKYPRVFDAVEERTFAYLVKIVPLEQQTRTTLEATNAWLMRLKERANVEHLIADAKFSEANKAFLNCHLWWSNQDFVSLVVKKKVAIGLANQAEEEKREAERHRAQTLAEEQRREADAAREEAEVRRLRNESRYFDLLIFDLDDTLLKSAHLEEFRGRENIGNSSSSYINELKKEAKDLKHLITEETLLEIKDIFPDISLSVFTRAPHTYAITLLEVCYPNIKWDSVVAFEDVEGKTKPDPLGVWVAACEAGYFDTTVSRCAVIGDQKVDILAAYQAGAFAILYTRAWGPDWKSSLNRTDHYRAIELMPDAIVERQAEIIKIISEPWRWLPLLESCDASDAHTNFKPHRATDKRNHFNNLENTPAKKQWVETFALGRYFSAHKHDSTYDFRPRSDQHYMTLKIIEAKDSNQYPDEWIARCAENITAEADFHLALSDGVIVCPVPARPGRPQRIEGLLERIAKAIGSKHGVCFNNDVLRFKEGVMSNKTLNADERFLNIRDHLYVDDSGVVDRKHVIVIDDITTTGATFYYADRYLKKAGACGVHCLSLAHAIS